MNQKKRATAYFGLHFDFHASDKAPTSITTVPENSLDSWTYDGKHIHVKLKKIEIHTVIAADGVL